MAQLGRETPHCIVAMDATAAVRRATVSTAPAVDMLRTREGALGGVAAGAACWA